MIQLPKTRQGLISRIAELNNIINIPHLLERYESGKCIRQFIDDYNVDFKDVSEATGMTKEMAINCYRFAHMSEALVRRAIKAGMSWTTIRNHCLPTNEDIPGSRYPNKLLREILDNVKNPTDEAVREYLKKPYRVVLPLSFQGKLKRLLRLRKQAGAVYEAMLMELNMQDIDDETFNENLDLLRQAADASLGVSSLARRVNDKLTTY